MSRAFYALLLVAAVGGTYYFCRHYEIRGLEKVEIQPRGAGKPGEAAVDLGKPPEAAGPSVRASGRRTLKIATVRLGLDEARLAKPPVAAMLVKMVSSFDIVAVQDIHARNQSLLADLVDRINAEGRHYDFAVAPRVLRAPVETYGAVVFDQAAVEIDRGLVAEVEDPAGRLAHRPLVAIFRARGPSPKEAFTFTLVNVEVDETRIGEERDALADVFRAVRDNGSGEDDVILLGDMARDDRRYGRLADVANIVWALGAEKDVPEGTGLTGNIFLDRVATAEFTGHAGVFDMMRQFNISIQEAAEAVDQLPVWAEFSVYEGNVE